MLTHYCLLPWSNRVLFTCCSQLFLILDSCWFSHILFVFFSILFLIVVYFSSIFWRTVRSHLFYTLYSALFLQPQLFHSVLDGYGSVSSACLSLLGAGGLLSWRPGWTITGPSSTTSSLLFHASFSVFRLVLLWLVTSVLLRNYRRARAELYRPAVDLQDYEMVELFLRRLKMWMGLSRAKEVR